jgi:hypothetical protein
LACDTHAVACVRDMSMCLPLGRTMLVVPMYSAFEMAIRAAIGLGLRIALLDHDTFDALDPRLSSAAWLRYALWYHGITDLETDAQWVQFAMDTRIADVYVLLCRVGSVQDAGMFPAILAGHSSLVHTPGRGIVERYCPVASVPPHQYAARVILSLGRSVLEIDETHRERAESAFLRVYRAFGLNVSDTDAIAVLSNRTEWVYDADLQGPLKWLGAEVVAPLYVNVCAWASAHIWGFRDWLPIPEPRTLVSMARHGIKQ